MKLLHSTFKREVQTLKGMDTKGLIVEGVLLQVLQEDFMIPEKIMHERKLCDEM